MQHGADCSIEEACNSLATKMNRPISLQLSVPVNVNDPLMLGWLGVSMLQQEFPVLYAGINNVWICS